MRPIPGDHGTFSGVELSKSETKTLLQASYVLKQIGLVLDDEDRHTQADTLQDVAERYGAKHLGADGNLIETPAKAAVTASAPE